ncbi:Spindle pole body component SPC98 [Spathaspora sp. JA1]|nr:Spindle pole body component SPC98 [Spathaspora sp. JA1]
MLDKSQLIKLYVHRLVKSLIPSEFGDEFIQSITNDVNISINNPNPHPSQDLNQIIQDLKVDFLSNGLHSEWIKFQEIVQSLAKFKTLDQVYNYLVFLDTLSQGSNGGTRRQNNPSARSIGSSGSPFKDSSAVSTGGISSPLSHLISPYYETLDEHTILTYLPYTLLGHDSHLFKFTGNSIEIPSNINNSFSDLLRDIFEYALIYKNLNEFIESTKGKLQSGIKTAFVGVVESELQEYVGEINRIFHRGITGTANTTVKSILFVYHSIYSWIYRFRIMHNFKLKMIQCEDGYDFLVYVYEFTKYGDLNVKQLSQRIFTEMIKPYYNIVEHWIVKGELFDDCQEFFISFDTEQEEFNKIIKFNPGKVPSFLVEVDKIFQIGKTLIFLNKYCRQLKWINQFNSKYSTIIFANNSGLVTMNETQQIELINQQYNEVLTFFTEIIQGQCCMFDHLRNCKKFYFMEDNEFIDCLILKGQEILNEPSTKISSTQLSNLLSDAMNLSKIDNDRLDARIISVSIEKIGWEVFTIEYRINDLPLNYLIENQHGQYLKIFNFLWKLRHLLNLLYENNRMFVQLSRLRIVRLVKVNVLRNRLVQFLNGLIDYLSNEIIEPSFQQGIIDKLFNNKNNEELLLNKSFVNRECIARAPPQFNINVLTIDEIISMHNNYLNKIIDNKILNEETRGKTTGVSFINQIYSILQTIYDFINTSQELHELMYQYSIGTSTDEEDLDELQEQIRIVKLKIYNEIYYKFQQYQDNFINDLKSDFELKDLSFSFI